MTKKNKEITAPTARLVLQAAISLAGSTQYAFEKKAGMSPGGLSRYLNGKNGPQMGIRKLREVLEANDIDSTWVLSKRQPGVHEEQTAPV